MLVLCCALCSTGIVNSLNKNHFITLEYVKRKTKTFEIQKNLGIIETSNT